MEQRANRKLFLLSVVSSLLVCLCIYFFVQLYIRQEFVVHDTDLIAEAVSRHAESTLSSEDFLAPSEDRFAEFFTDLSCIAEMTLIKVWAPNGTIIYSDHAALVGLSYPDHERFNRAMAGVVTQETNPSSGGEGLTIEDALEISVPIEKEGVVVGVIELYGPLDTLEAVLVRLRIKLAIGLFASFLLLVVATTFLFWEGDRVIKQQTAQLQETNERLVAADRGKDSFLHHINHEIRTPLTAIKAFSEMLIAGDMGKLRKEQQEAMETIHTSVDALEGTINEVLDLSKLEAGKMIFNLEEAAPADLILPVVRELGALAQKKRLKLAGKVQKSLPKVRCDTLRIRGAVRNLVSNAIKYTIKGSIVVSTTKDGEFLRIDVTDTGVGIADDEIPKLFSKFYQAGRVVPQDISGTGLGLSIVKAVIEQHGGSVTVRSELGRGSTFTIRLPVAGPGDAKNA